jgi:hypothetical protein
MPTAPTVFISYSHQDEVWKDRLLEHLGVLEEEGLLKTWNDRNIGAGDEWLEEIRTAMSSARVAVFLVSAHSLKSKFIRHQEIPHLLDRREKEGMTFFPVIVKACVWDELPWLSRFQARPLDGRPLAGFQGNRRDAELTKIAKEILSIVRNGAPHVRPTNPPDVARPTILAPLHQLPTPPGDFTGREEDPLRDVILLKIGPDGTLVNDHIEFRVKIKEVLLSLEEGRLPRFKIEACREAMARIISDVETLERLEFQSSSDLTARIEALKRRVDLPLADREELLDYMTISREYNQKAEVLCRALDAVLIEPVLRKSGFLSSADDIRCVVTKIVERFFGKGRVSHNSTRIDLYRLAEPELSTHIRLSPEEFDALMANTGFTERAILTLGGEAWRLVILPVDLILEKAIPAVLLEVYQRHSHMPSYEPKPEFLDLSSWYLGLG